MRISGQDTLLQSFQSTRPFGGLTHSFYLYPARFSPEFARECILQFSREGDCVLDAFMGGATTIVEALANGRNALGIDINPLSHFVATVKTTPLSARDKEGILHWVDALDLESPMVNEPAMNDPRLKNVPEGFRELLVYATSTVGQLRFSRQRRFARCALLRLGQWALDCREDMPSGNHMKKQLLKQVSEMLEGLDDLVEAARSRGVSKKGMTSKRALYIGATQRVVQDMDVARCFPKAKLLLTSPPYPGVHVLYHRWQVNGRRETPAPYWLAGLSDGHFASYFTMGSRTATGLTNYFRQLTDTFAILRQLLDPQAIIVQLVAFSDPETQVPAFLSAMGSAGYQELTPFADSDSERPTRNVPYRKWYTCSGGNQHAANEVLLVHRLVK